MGFVRSVVVFSSMDVNFKRHKDSPSLYSVSFIMFLPNLNSRQVCDILVYEICRRYVSSGEKVPRPS